MMHPHDQKRVSSLLQSTLTSGLECCRLLAEQMNNVSMPVVECFTWLDHFCHSECEVTHLTYAHKLVTFCDSGLRDGHRNASSSVASASEKAASPVSPAVVLRFRYLRLSGGAHAVALEDDVCNKIKAVLAYIESSANQALGPGNPMHNAGDFIDSFNPSKRPRHPEVTELGLKSTPILQSRFGTESHARFVSEVAAPTQKESQEESRLHQPLSHSAPMATVENHQSLPGATYADQMDTDSHVTMRTTSHDDVSDAMNYVFDRAILGNGGNTEYIEDEDT